MCGHSQSLSREEIVKNIALDLGFSLVGIASLEPDARSNQNYAGWLAAGMHGDMTYLERHRPLREDAA
ncbi:MAG TPA: hypothetical protein VFU38_03670, partial [Candidatus Krumholzibacteria bacterium]|nr:hypothetical protein [Candidatus Krumholzibacteria bacterium]